MRDTKLIFLIPALVSGGAERVVASLCNSFCAKGYEVILVMLNACEQPSYKVDEGVKVISLIGPKRNFGLPARILDGFRTFFRLFKVLRLESPSMVFSFQTSANLWGGTCCFLLKIPYIVSERTSPDRTINKKPAFLQRTYAFVYKHAKSVVAPSAGILDRLRQNKYFKKLDNLHLIRNYVEHSCNGATPKVHPNRFVLGAGRLEFVKGFDRLIDSFSQMKTSGVDLVIAGKGDEKEGLAKRISTLGLERKVFLVGEVENIHDYYRQCELFVLPSRNEGYPNVLIEAMSVGCPCIAADCEFGPAEIIKDGENGLLISESDMPRLSNVMDRVLGSDSLRNGISNNARKVLVTNSYENILNEWEKLIIKYA